MDTTSINRLFRAGKLKRDGFGPEVLRPGKPLHIARPADAGILEGRHDGHRKSSGGGAKVSMAKKLASLLGPAREVAVRASSQGAAPRGAFDRRQRAIVKIHYFSHARGGGAALRAHARYVARDAATKGVLRDDAAGHGEPAEAETADKRAKAHARYLARSGEARSVFYDALSDGVDGPAKAAKWAGQDRRHFRLILAPENGSALGDLRSYTREVMRRAETALGTRLEWVAVDHWDTDNPHTHVILRGVRDDGRDLIMPREFVQHGFRSVARDVATERLGERTPNDERLALQREARAHRPTQLDRSLAAIVPPDGPIRLADIRLPYVAPEYNDALKARARELERLGLAEEVKRNVLRFRPGWQEALKAMELHLDIRKALMRSRAIDIAKTRGAHPLSTMLRTGQGPER